MKKRFNTKNNNPKNMKRLDCSIEWDVKSIEKAADGKLKIKGYANTKDRDRVGDVILPEAFKGQLPEYLKNPVLLYMHDWDRPCGKVVKAEIDDNGLMIEAEISNANSCEDIRKMIKEGILKTFSIGYNELDSDWDKETATNYVKEIELLEISIVTIPCNAQAMFAPVIEDEGSKSVSKNIKTSNGDIYELNDDVYDFYVEKINSAINDGKTITKCLMKEFELEFCSIKKAKKITEKSVISDDQAEFISQMLNELDNSEEVDTELIVSISKTYNYLKENNSELIEKK